MKKLLLGLLVFSATLLLGTVLAPKTEAIITDTFIDTSNVSGTNIQDALLAVESTPASQVPGILLKWFRPVGDNSNGTIRFQNFCNFGVAGENAEAWVEFRRYNAGTLGWDRQTFPGFNVWGVGNFSQLPDIGNGCSGNDLVIGNVPESWWQVQTGLYDGFEVLLVSINLRDPDPANGNIRRFRAVDDTNNPHTYVTQAEIGNPQVHPSVGGFPGPTTAFAVLGNRTAEQHYDLHLNFAPNCNSPAGTYYLYWRDVDYDQLYGDQTYWELRDDLNNVQSGFPAGSAAMGGSNVYGWAAVNLDPNRSYRWSWYNIDHLNIIHFWMPFSEINIKAGCKPQQPVGYIDSCRLVGSTTTIYGWAYDDNASSSNDPTTSTYIWDGSGNYVTGQDNNTDKSYRTADIETFLDGGNYGIANRNGIYGFEATFTTLVRGNTYHIGGIINNVGNGVNQWMGVNPGPGPPTNGIIGSVGFPLVGSDYTIPSSCLPPPLVTIQGRVFRAFTGQQLNDVTMNNITIDYCQGTTTTGWNGSFDGNFSFQVPEGSTFCVSISALSAGSSGGTSRVQPWSVGYNLCNGTAPDGYCQAGSYINQVAGVANGGDDRSINVGYDIALTWPPAITCSIGGGSLGVVIVNVPRPMPSTTVSVSANSGSPYNGVSGSMSVVGINGTSFTPSPASGTYSNADAAGATVNYTAGTLYTFSSAGTAEIRGTPSGTYGSGWYALTATVSTCDASGTVGVGPYMKVYGGDVWAGGGFSPNCTTTAGEITTFGSTSAPFRGASAQFGVSALLSINQFYSASQRDPAAVPANTQAPKGLTFANSAGTYGGGLGGGARCITNYWDKTRITAPAPAAFVPSAVFPAGVGKQQYFNPGSLTIDTGGTDISVPLGSQIAIFVDGDVQINDNIMYQAGATYQAGTAEELSQMPLLIIVARGNIRIDNNVTRIDAVLIAQPCASTTTTDPATCNSTRTTVDTTPTPGGTIYTCTRLTGAINSGADLYSECNTAVPGGQLVINGALIANRVKFQRAFGRFDTALTREAPSDFNTGAVIAGGNGPGEVINYTPEVYLAPSPLKNPSAPSDNPNVGPYNAAAGLPPIF